jgi:hypothetical protein
MEGSFFFDGIDSCVALSRTTRRRGHVSIEQNRISHACPGRRNPGEYGPTHACLVARRNRERKLSRIDPPAPRDESVPPPRDRCEEHSGRSIHCPCSKTSWGEPCHVFRIPISYRVLFPRMSTLLSLVRKDIGYRTVAQA